MSELAGRMRNAPASSQRSSNRALVALAISAIALTALSLAVGMAPLSIDATDGALANLRDGGAGAPLLAAADTVGSLPIWAVLILVIAVLMAKSGLRPAIELGVVTVLAEAATTLLKVVVARPRPAGGPTLDLLVASGFPSGHVTRTAVLAGAILVLVPWGARHPRLTIAAGVVGVAVMGMARVSGRAHHTSDVLGACLLAAAMLAAWQLVRSRRATKTSFAGLPMAIAVTSVGNEVAVVAETTELFRSVDGGVTWTGPGA